LAGTALFQFFLDGTLRGSFIANLAPDKLFEFKLPILAEPTIANCVIITNITPVDPTREDLDVAGMAFIDAGVAHPIAASRRDRVCGPGGCRGCSRRPGGR
jgi:hypothetical protein